MTRNELNDLVDDVVVYGFPCPVFSYDDRDFIISQIDDEYADYSQEESVELDDYELLRNCYSGWSAWVQCNT